MKEIQEEKYKQAVLALEKQLHQSGPMHGGAGIAAALILITEAIESKKDILSIKIDGFDFKVASGGSDWIVEVRKVVPNARCSAKPDTEF